MKVAIIGGGGRVGACAAFALQTGGIVREIQLVDVNRDMAEGEALDLLHGSALCADQRIHAGGYEEASDSDLFLITAGLRRKPDESRMDLIARNVSLFMDILGGISGAGYSRQAVVLVVSNPVDILTHLAGETLDLPRPQVLGLGTMLDTARFSSLIAQELDLPPSQVRAWILGEHGDTMLPVWSSATLQGLPLAEVRGCTPAFQSRIFERTRKSGAEVIGRKGGAGWAVALSIAEVIHAVALDSMRVLPVSSRLEGAYGIRDISLSVPAVVGRKGIRDHLELKLWPREATGLQKSAAALKENLEAARRQAGTGR